MIENSANNISQLNENWPQRDDFISEGDDHFRIVKKTIKQTFSKITDLVNVSHLQLNNIARALKNADEANSLTFFGKLIIKDTGEIQSSLPKRTAAQMNDNSLLDWKTAFDLTHPVGSIYITTTNENPSVTFGKGTWEAFSQGRALSGSGANGMSGTNTGGSVRKTLQVADLPAHSHYVSLTTSTNGNHTHGYTRIDQSGRTYDVTSRKPSHQAYTAQTSAAGNHTHTVSGNTHNTGSNSAFSIMQPWQSSYMWKRTA